VAAGFRNTTCAIGTHLTPAQLAQLRENPDLCVYIASIKIKTSGQNAANALLHCLDQAGLHVRLVTYPPARIPTATSPVAPPPKILPISWRGSFTMSVRLVVKTPCLQLFPLSSAG